MNVYVHIQTSVHSAFHCAAETAVPVGHTKLAHRISCKSILCCKYNHEKDLSTKTRKRVCRLAVSSKVTFINTVLEIIY